LALGTPAAGRGVFLPPPPISNALVLFALVGLPLPRQRLGDDLSRFGSIATDFPPPFFFPPPPPRSMSFFRHLACQVLFGVTGMVAVSPFLRISLFSFLLFETMRNHSQVLCRGFPLCTFATGCQGTPPFGEHRTLSLLFLSFSDFPHPSGHDGPPLVGRSFSRKFFFSPLPRFPPSKGAPPPRRNLSISLVAVGQSPLFRSDWDGSPNILLALFRSSARVQILRGQLPPPSSVRT